MRYLRRTNGSGLSGRGLVQSQRRLLVALSLCLLFGGCVSPTTPDLLNCPQPSALETEDYAQIVSDDPDRHAVRWIGRVVGYCWPEKAEEARKETTWRAPSPNEFLTPYGGESKDSTSFSLPSPVSWCIGSGGNPSLDSPLPRCGSPALGNSLISYQLSQSATLWLTGRRSSWAASVQLTWLF